MAESILTSINLAGGSFNVYYDTVLGVHSSSVPNSTLSVTCPSGWKVAIINIAEADRSNLYAMPVFNLGNTGINYYIPNSRGGYFGVYVYLTQISSPINGTYANAAMTVIFLA